MRCIMAKRKIEPITGVPSEDKLTVLKSLPLFALWQSELTLAEFKILDTYLSRIDSHHPEKRVVLLEKGELEGLLGVRKINRQDLEMRLKHLMEQVVKLEDNSKRGFRFVSLFEEAIAEQDDNGLWQVRLECTQKAMMYFFNVDSLGYLRYKLRCITALTSRYTYIMFTYLEHNRYRKSWEIGLDELKVLLHCETEETYKAFKRFNDLVLKKTYRELHEKTECRYSYEPIKKGRSVVAVRFTVETLPALDVEPVDPDQYTIDDLQRVDEDRDSICGGFSAPEFADFNEDELRVLKDMAWAKMRQDDVDRHNAVLGDYKMSCEYAAADYLRQQILMAKTRHPKNLYAYVTKMISNDT